MELIVSSLTFKDSFLEAVREYQKEKISDHLDIQTLSLKALQKDFLSYIEKLEDESHGKGLSKEYVPQTTYWLIDNKEFIGRVSIRRTLIKHLLKEGGHIGYDIRPSKRNLGYGKKILFFVLPKAKAMGIAKVLVTCDETNLASKKIIEFNGGVFENSISVGNSRPDKLRYWIDLH